MAEIAERDERAGTPARELLEWAEEQAFELEYTEQDAVVLTPRGGTLVRIVGYEELVRVSLPALRSAGDETTTEGLIAALTDLGFKLGKRHAKTPLARFAGEPGALAAFEALMEQARTALA